MPHKKKTIHDKKLHQLMFPLKLLFLLAKLASKFLQKFLRHSSEFNFNLFLLFFRKVFRYVSISNSTWARPIFSAIRGGLVYPLDKNKNIWCLFQKCSLKRLWDILYFREKSVILKSSIKWDRYLTNSYTVYAIIKYFKLPRWTYNIKRSMAIPGTVPFPPCSDRQNS